MSDWIYLIGFVAICAGVASALARRTTITDRHEHGPFDP